MLKVLPSEEYVHAASTFSHEASGGVTVTTSPFNRTEFAVWYAISLPVDWTIGSYISVSQELRWNTGDIPLNWYQIQSALTYNVTAETCGIEPDDPTIRGLQGLRMQRIASGRSVADLCNKLTEKSLSRPIKWKFDTIKRYNRAIYTADDEPDYDSFIDESWCEVPECAEFCLAADADVPIGVVVQGGRVFRWTGIGSVYIGGTGDGHVPPYTKVASGGVSLGGAAGVASSAWRFIPTTTPPNLIANGASHNKTSAYSFNASGSAAVTGTSETKSSAWSYVSDGSVYCSGEASFKAVGRLSFNSSGVGILASGDATVEGIDYHYITEMYGGVGLGGTSAVVGDRAASMLGSVSVGGTSHFRSVGYRFGGIGGVGLGSKFKLGYSHLASGSMSIEGTSPSRPGCKFIATGGLIADGSAGFVSSNCSHNASGGVVLGGAAETHSSFLGRFRVFIGAVSELEEMGMVVVDPAPEEPVINMEIPTAVDTDCGYSVTPQIELRHNLADKENLFANFLVRSGYTIPDRLFLSYNVGRNVWQWSAHYQTSSEVWDLLFEFVCTDQLGDAELGEMAWRLNVIISQNVGGIVKKSRIGTAFNSGTVRNPLTGAISIDMSLDVFNRVVTTTATQVNGYLVLEDRIGLFLPDGLSEVNFYISEVNTPPPTPIVALEGFITNVAPARGVAGVTATTGTQSTTPSSGTAASLVEASVSTVAAAAGNPGFSTILGARPAAPISSDVRATVGKETGIEKPSPYKSVTRQKVKVMTPKRAKGQESRIFNK